MGGERCCGARMRPWAMVRGCGELPNRAQVVPGGHRAC
jgi:hypothetical protein